MRDEQVFRLESGEARRDGVDNFLVDIPDRIPFEIRDRLRRTLKEHILRESVDRHSSSSNTYFAPSVLCGDGGGGRGLTSDGGESRIVPSSYMTFFDKPFELPLRQERVYKVHSSITTSSARSRQAGKAKTDPKSQTSTFRNLRASSIH